MPVILFTLIIFFTRRFWKFMFRWMFRIPYDLYRWGERVSIGFYRRPHSGNTILYNSAKDKKVWFFIRRLYKFLVFGGLLVLITSFFVDRNGYISIDFKNDYEVGKEIGWYDGLKIRHGEVKEFADYDTVTVVSDGKEITKRWLPIHMDYTYEDNIVFAAVKADANLVRFLVTGYIELIIESNKLMLRQK